MPMAERMKLAEGRPLRRRMMAAMAQQDCGQCGYNCEDYSDAIFAQDEERLNLCVPGGKETARMLKSLYERARHARRAGSKAPRRGRPATRRARGRRRAARATIRRTATFLSRAPPQQAGLREGDLAYRVRPHRRRLDYVVGDAFGLFPTNDPALADAVIAGARHASPDYRRSAAARCARC